MVAERRVYIVEDDESVRHVLRETLSAAKYDVLEFDRAEPFLAQCRPNMRGCIVLDLRMPGLTGLDVQEELRRRSVTLPIIFVSGFGDVPTTVKAMQGGAVTFLEKPFNGTTLLAAVEQAIRREVSSHVEGERRRELEQRQSLLTDREREVLEKVVTGMTNKGIGLKFGISEKTVKVHRGRVMEKMQAGSLAELVLMAQVLGICGPEQLVRDLPEDTEDEE